jgi:hypothetical protein
MTVDARLVKFTGVPQFQSNAAKLSLLILGVLNPFRATPDTVMVSVPDFFPVLIVARIKLCPGNDY